MRRILLVLFVSMTLYGCLPHDRLLFIEESHLGLIAKASPDATAPADIDFGYRRSIVTLTPQKKADVGKEREVPLDYDYGELLSVISSFKAKVGWFSDTEIHTYFATGEAATKTGRQAEAIKALVAPPTTPSQ